MQNQQEITCFFPHSNGTLYSIEANAQRLDEENQSIAGIKLANADKALQKRFKEVVETARLTEFKPDREWKINCHINPGLTQDDQSWELAAVVADRCVRGLLAKPEGRLFALGCSAHWEIGQITALDDIAHSNALKSLQRHIQVDDSVYLAESGETFSRLENRDLQNRRADINYLTHLGGLSGQPDPNRAVRSAKVYFPLINGNSQHDCLATVTVTVIPVAADAAIDEPNQVRCLGGLSRAQQRIVRATLEQSRAFDQQRTSQWQTVVRFSRDDFQDQSYQLALVMADRIARGRDVPPQNRLIATGCSSRWANGEVHHVEHQSSKLRLLANSVMANDRLLLPSSWQNAVDSINSWAAEPISIACIDSLDIYKDG